MSSGGAQASVVQGNETSSVSPERDPLLLFAGSGPGKYVVFAFVQRITT
jgi:hypothetical protein